MYIIAVLIGSAGAFTLAYLALWVLPPGAEEDFPFLIPAADNDVMTQEEGDAKYGKIGGKQRNWQPGIPTGKGLAS